MQPVAQYNSCTVSSASLDIMEQRSGSEATASLGSSTMTAAARLQAARQRLAAREAPEHDADAPGRRARALCLGVQQPAASLGIGCAAATAGRRPAIIF